MLRRGIAFVLLAAVALGALLYSQRRTGPYKVSGVIEADEIRIGSRVGGRVRRVLVEEGDEVKSGMVLVELEPFDLLEKKAEATALLAQQRAELARLEAGFRDEEIAQAAARVEQLKAVQLKLKNGPRPEEIRVADLQVKQAEAQHTLAKATLARTESLFGTKPMAATKEQLDEATSNYQVALRTLEVNREKLKLLREGTRKEELDEAEAKLEEARQAHLLAKNGYRREEIDKARAAVRALEATLQAIDVQILELSIRGPTGSVVQASEIHPGDLVSANAPVMSLVDLKVLWVRAYIPENRLDLTTNPEAWVTVDSYPNEAFRARISFVSDQAEFTPRNVQTPEERSKQVFRIKVTLLEGHGRLRPGMAADVWFEKPATAK